MLVKQWLREYLATENPSPQARLRIRHQRHPALKTWHVLEIGASLPFLLQLALALFFVGVCYFTAEIHASIGHTTLPLVIAWVICFAFATALPIIFPRCPYKTTLLTAIVRSLHTWITSGFAYACIGSVSSPETAYYMPRGMTRVEQFRIWLTSYLSSINERQVERRPDTDLDILVAVDTIQFNDELLATTLTEALSQAQRHWTDAVNHFVLAILEKRLQLECRDPNFDWSTLDLQPLTNRARLAIIDILVQHMVGVPLEGEDPAKEQQAALAAFAVLTWSPPGTLPPLQLGNQAREVVNKCLLYHGNHIYSTMASYAKYSGNGITSVHGEASQLLRQLTGLLDIVDCSLDHAVEWLETIINECSKAAPEAEIPPFKCLDSIWEAWTPTSSQSSQPTQDVSPALLTDATRLAIAEYLIKSVKRMLVKLGPDKQVPQRYFEVLSFACIVQSSVVDEFRTSLIVDFQTILRALLSTVNRAEMLVETLLYVPLKCLLNPSLHHSILGNLFSSTNETHGAYLRISV